MAKKYTGSLTLDWFNKQKSILVKADEAGVQEHDVPAPKMNWINKDQALFYELVDEEGRGLSPYWVNRSDLRVKEARPLVFQKAYKAVEKPLAGSLIDNEYSLFESDQDDSAIKNILIRGDNLLALNALKKLFARLPDEEKVKCIYIDPPYNTGSAFKQYDDNLAHSEWLTLIRDRLQILWSLLSQDGSLWVSIDDDEMPYLRALMDEVCGRQNFIASNVWQKRYSRENREAIGDAHEYVICYAKQPDRFKAIRNQLPLGEKQLAVYKNPNNDPKGEWRAVSLSAQGYRPNQMYEIVSPVTGKKHRPPEGSCWKVIEPEYKRLLSEGRIYFGKDGNAVPSRIQYLRDIEGIAPWTWWPHEEVGHTDESKREVQLLFGKSNAFETPKPERLIERIIQIATNPGDKVLDAFAGSGTTGAVAHKMGRQWIMIEVGAHCEMYVIPRLKKVLTGDDQGGVSRSVKWRGGGSFKYHRLGDSIIDATSRDFNWKLSRDFIERSLLSSYDFSPDSEFSLTQRELINTTQLPSIGFNRIGQRQMAAVVSLVEPQEEKPITYDEFMTWYDALKKFKGTQSIVVLTNRGVEIAYDSKPDDLEVVKVPHAIFAELEK